MQRGVVRETSLTRHPNLGAAQVWIGITIQRRVFSETSLTRHPNLGSAKFG
jgi:hypothetical protein